VVINVPSASMTPTTGNSTLLVIDQTGSASPAGHESIAATSVGSC
jgi:hypothetical protein